MTIGETTSSREVLTRRVLLNESGPVGREQRRIRNRDSTFGLVAGCRLQVHPDEAVALLVERVLPAGRAPVGR